jgi:hypothetical protein
VTAPPPFPNAERILSALPFPMLVVGGRRLDVDANAAAEDFFDMSAGGAAAGAIVWRSCCPSPPPCWP